MENIERLFYYTSERIINKSAQSKASAAQWSGILRKQITDEEENHLGILEWLTEQGNSKLSKDELLLYINKNRLKINEVIIPEDAINPVRKKYTTGNLTNYREIVITVPDLEEYYTDEIHFSDVSNGQEICWCRCADYYEECKILVIDEMQSSRHQDAREYGYKSDYTNYWSDDVVRQILDDRSLSIDDWCKKLNKYYEDIYRNSVAVKNAVPDTPFKKWWRFLSKRMLQYAVSNEYSQMRITSGDMQISRYSLDEKENKGLKDLYDNIIMGYFTKYLKQWDIVPYLENNWWCIDLTTSIKEDIVNNLQPLLKSIKRGENETNDSLGIGDHYPMFNGVFIDYLAREDIRSSRVLGWYDRPYDRVYIVVNNHNSIRHLNSTIIHEVIAHYGLKKLLGERYIKFLNGIYTQVMTIEDRNHYLQIYKNWITAVEEYCAEIFEKKPSENVSVEYACCHLKTMLSETGLENDMTIYELWDIMQPDKLKLYI